MPFSLAEAGALVSLLGRWHGLFPQSGLAFCNHLRKVVLSLSLYFSVFTYSVVILYVNIMHLNNSCALLSLQRLLHVPSMSFLHLLIFVMEPTEFNKLFSIAAGCVEAGFLHSINMALFSHCPTTRTLSLCFSPRFL